MGRWPEEFQSSIDKFAEGNRRAQTEARATASTQRSLEVEALGKLTSLLGVCRAVAQRASERMVPYDVGFITRSKWGWLASWYKDGYNDTEVSRGWAIVKSTPASYSGTHAETIYPAVAGLMLEATGNLYSGVAVQTKTSPLPAIVLGDSTLVTPDKPDSVLRGSESVRFPNGPVGQVDRVQASLAKFAFDHSL